MEVFLDLRLGSLVALVFLYLLLKKGVSSRKQQHSEPSDEDRLSSLALVRKCSAYELFKAAGEPWNFSSAKVESDFRGYLKDGRIPRYVDDYVVKHINANDVMYRSLIHPEEGQPKSWSA